MRHTAELTGRIFGRLTVLGKAEPYLSPQGRRKSQVLAKCQCGTEKVIMASNLLRGLTTSCGCYKRERSTKVGNGHLIGHRFGRLTVVRELEPLRGLGRLRRGVQRRYEARCDCGNTSVALDCNLKHGRTRSCGCFKLEYARAGHNVTHGATVGGKTTDEFSIWGHIIQRCKNPNMKSYPDYGGRGIKVCDRWRNSFSAFLEDMGPRPSQEHSIERENNDGHYEPGNCRWATRLEQANNKRTTHFVTVDGVTKPISEWCRIQGVDRRRVFARMRRDGWTATQALGFEPKPSRRRST